MSRRRPRAEIQFGSDSFLDVVANIVGILIILIVIAGLRVSRTPVVKKQPEIFDTTSKVETSLPKSPLPHLAEAIEGQTDASHVVVLEPVNESEPPPLPPLVAPQDLVDLADELEAQLAALEAEEALASDALKHSSDQQAALLDKQRTVQSRLEEKKKEIAASQKKAAKRTADLELSRQTLARLTNQVNELATIPAHVETLEHKITPISREVNGKEKHYRLEKNRVAEVPIDELVESFREQIDRRKDWLIKIRRHEGQIGPIRGFNLKYIVRVENSTEIETMRTGIGGYRISLASWEVHPEPDLKGENEEAALRRGSQFYQSILGAAPDTTLTFWVYPDSYALFRRLQKFTHEHGFSVAGRPLPTGVPIAGSPNGSKSASQ